MKAAFAAEKAGSSSELVEASHQIADHLALIAGLIRLQGADAFTKQSGLRTTSLTSAAIADGFRYVDGNSVRSLVDAPQEVRRFGLAELYRLAAGARP